MSAPSRAPPEATKLSIAAPSCRNRRRGGCAVPSRRVANLSVLFAIGVARMLNGLAAVQGVAKPNGVRGIASDESTA